MGPRKYLTTVRREKKKGESRSKEGVFVVERRKHPRIKIELPLDYSLVDRGETHRGSGVNTSEGGLLVYLPEAMEIGAVLKIGILFVKGFEQNVIQGIAKVVKSIVSLDRYPWCGHAVLMGHLKYSWQDCKYVLSWFGPNNSALKAYHQYLSEGVSQGSHPESFGGRVFQPSEDDSAGSGLQQSDDQQSTDRRIGNENFVSKIKQEIAREIKDRSPLAKLRKEVQKIIEER